MSRIVRRFFILPNAARSHDLIDIRLMQVQPGTIVPMASRRRRQPAEPPQNIATPPTQPGTTQPGTTKAEHSGAEHSGNNNTGTIEPPATPATRTKPVPTKKPDTDQPKAWHVVLLDSEEHTYEYVIEMMMNIFRHPIEKAFQIAKQVDELGRAVCATTHRELAELRVEQVRGFGADPRIASCKRAMRCYLEPAE